jgi:hypothetical protein
MPGVNMKFLQSITSLLRRGSTRFSVLEVALLEEVERHLALHLADRLRRRIERINLVQRLDGGREVNAYSLKNGRPTFDEATRLIAEDDERKLATFSFVGANQIRYEGAAWLVNGQLFSLEFNNPTEHVLDDRPTDVKLSICI